MFDADRRRARTACDATIIAARNKIEGAIEKYPALPRDVGFLDALTIANPPADFAPMSNLLVRRIASETLIDVFLDHYAATRHLLDRRHFLLTATFDDGIVSEAAPVVRFDHIKRKVADVLREYRLSGLCVFECDVLAKKLDGESDRTLLVHAHGHVWTDDPNFSPTRVANALAGRRRFSHCLDVRPFTFTSREESSRRWRGWVRPQAHLDVIPANVAHLAYYLLKAPHFAKNRIVIPGQRVRMLGDAGHFYLKTALRMAELWSYFTPATITFGIGDGRELTDTYRLQVSRRLARWTAVGTTPTKKLDRFWHRQWQRNSSANFKASAIYNP